MEQYLLGLIFLAFCCIGPVAFIVYHDRKKINSGQDQDKPTTPQPPIIAKPKNKASINDSPGAEIDQSITINNNTYKQPRGILDWQKWQVSKEFENTFFSNETINNWIKEIHSNVSVQEKNSIIRILGLGGLGKSRLVFEMIKGLPEIQNKIIYCNAFLQRSNLYDAISDLIQREELVIIIDNCDLELHDQLRRIIVERDNSVHLITISHNIHEKPYGTIPIKIQDKDFENIIPQIIRNKYPSLNDSDVQRISEFSQGFPLIAVQIAKAKLDNEDNLGELSDDALFNKLLGDITTDEEQILKACAIFNYVGKTDDVKSQLEFLAQNSFISRLRGTNDEKLILFKNTITKFRKRGLIEKAGRFIQIKPKPLAIKLAAEWWRGIDAEDFDNTFLETIQKNGLSDALCKQMEMLHFLPEAQEFVKDMCGPLALFGNAEILNMDGGSRIFRSFSLVNHHATTNALHRLFIDKPIDELFKIDQGRRNLVWGLEYMCGKEDTFTKATKVLLLLAAAENETMSNNATGQFLQLFSIRLPGTEATLNERAKIIQFALNYDDVRVQNLGLQASSRALYAPNSFHRMNAPGEENIGIKIQDYYPKDLDEIKTYWKDILDSITPFVKTNPKFIIQAQEIIGNNIRSSFIYKSDKLILDAIKELKDDNDLWGIALGNTLNTFEFEAYKRKDQELIYLKELLQILKPKKIEQLYSIGVKNPIQSLYLLNNPLDRKKEYNDRDAIVQSYYREWATSIINDFKQSKISLQFLFEGEQNSGFAFGHTLGNILNEIYSDEEAMLDFVKKSILAIKNIHKDKLNLNVLGGIMDSFDRLDVKHKIFKTVIENDIHYHQVIYLAPFAKLPLSELKILINKYKSEESFLVNFYGFAYRNALGHLNIDDKIHFGHALAECGREGSWAAIHILERPLKEKENFSSFRDQIKQIIMVDGVVSQIQENHSIGAMYVIEWIRELLKEKSDQDFINFIIKEVIKNISDKDIPFVDSNIEKLFNLLLSYHFELAFPQIGELLSNYLTSIKIKRIIGVNDGFFYSEGIIFQDQEKIDILYEWCEAKPLIRFPIIAELMPTEAKGEDDKITWHPFAKKVLDNYGNIEHVLSRVSNNLGTYGTVGSSLDYLTSKKVLMESIQDHSIPEVRNWAIKHIAQYKREIKDEINFHKERAMR